MNFYLSSFRIGNEPATLRRLAAGRTLGFVPNAIDHLAADDRAASNAQVLQEVRGVGLDVELLDLQSYLGKSAELGAKLGSLGGVFVRGGNTFVLRQAMRLSGFDDLITNLHDSDFLYAGYSAGICVLAPRLDGLQHVDDPAVRAYGEEDNIWEGLGLLDYLILPHYKSDHPESAAIDVEVEYCEREGIAFRPLRDGEVIVIEGAAEPGSASRRPTRIE